MTRSRLKRIVELARRARGARLRQLFEEVYGGATAGSALTEETLRRSVTEAAQELLAAEKR